jgi:hypothetical protein
MMKIRLQALPAPDASGHTPDDDDGLLGFFDQNAVSPGSAQ